MKAIANILREAADKIAALNPPSTLAASESSLPDPPKPSPLAGLVSPMGCHNVIMGPLKVNAVNESQEEDIAQLCDDGKWRFGAVGLMSTPYAIRKGSEIARLNGLELTLELGRTYATKERAKASWTIKVCDSFVEYEFKIAGRGDTSIDEVANNAAKFLKGSIQSSGQTRKYSDPKVEDMIEALECAYHGKVGWMDAVEHALNPVTGKESA